MSEISNTDPFSLSDHRPTGREPPNGEPRVDPEIFHLGCPDRRSPYIMMAMAEGTMTAVERRAQSADALEAAVRHHIDLVYAAALRQTRNADVAQDVTQAVFIVLQKKWGSFNDGRLLGAWLLRVTRYASLNATKLARRRAFHEARAAAMRSEVEPGQALGSRELDGGMVDKALDQLSVNDRQAIVLSVIQEKSHGEVAAALNISSEAARKRIDRALARLGKLLATRGVTAGVSGVTALLGNPAPAPAAVVAGVHACLGGQFPATVGILAQGVVVMMKLMKVKAAGILAAALLAVAATGVFSYQALHAQPATMQGAPTPAAATPSADLRPKIVLSKAAEAEFSRVYALPENGVLMHVPPPFVPARLEFYEAADPVQANAIPAGPKGMFVEWTDNGPQPQGMAFGDGYQLNDVIDRVLGVSPQDLEGDENLLETFIPGDFVIRPHAAEDKLISAIERIFDRELHKHIRLEYQNVKRSVWVLHGAWKYAGIDRGTGDGIPKNTVQFYGQTLNSDPTIGGGGAGGAHEFAKSLGWHINAGVIIEADALPETIHWRINTLGDGKAESRNKARDPELVLAHVREQTGLVAKREDRLIRRLMVVEKP